MLSNAFVVGAYVTAAISPVVALWPIPQHSSTGNDVLRIDQKLEVTYNGQPLRWTSQFYSSQQNTRGVYVSAPLANRNGTTKFDSKEIVQSGLSRTFDAIFDQGFVPWMLRQPGSDWEPAPGHDTARIKSLHIAQTGKDDANTFKPVAGTVDESYSLNITTAGDATISAVSSTGILRALETFSQFFFKHSASSTWYTQMAPITIQDAPKFPHRGMVLDVGRHWFSVADIKRTIDALAMNKMNVLHLHATDTQSWPLEIPALPLLAEKGAYHKSLTYSPEDIRGIHDYAVHRGVQVITEIDMPGHVGIDKAYPGLSVAYGAKPYSKYCAQPPCGALRLNNTKVEGFLDTLFEDLLPRVSPYTSYFHTGGDEYNAANSLLDPDLKTDDKAVLQPMLQRFLDHAHDKIRDLGLIPMIWEEMVLDWNTTVGKDTVIQSWLGKNAIKRLAEAGHKVIDSSYEFYYLPCGRGKWLDYRDGAALNRAYPFKDWCQPTKNWRVIYMHDPVAGISEDAAKNVLGGEVAVWTETIDPTSLDTIVWPRASAAGESWWSGRTDQAGTNRSLIDARPRLAEMRERMLVRGVRGAPITQLWCDQNPVEDCIG